MIKNRRNRIIAGLLLVVTVGLVSAPLRIKAETGAAEQVQSFSDQLMAVLKKAMPPAPPGWTIRQAGQTPDGYTVVYRRIAGVRDEQQKLDQAYEESARRNNEAAKPAIDELIRQQTRTSLALKKATRRKNAAEQQRLNDELDENGRRMRALHEETEGKIARDVAPYLIHDAEATVSVMVNAEAAELPNAAPFVQKGAAFAVRTEGAQSGTLWREGKTLLLYGSWQPAHTSLFRGVVKQSSPQKAQTVKITIIGEKKRTEQLLKQMDLNRVLSLL